MKAYQIVPMTKEYIEAYHVTFDCVARELKFLAMVEAPPLEMFRKHILENLSKNFPFCIAISEEKIVGWCDIGSYNRPIFAHVGLLAMGVLSDYRGQGIGEELIRVTLERAKEIGLKRIALSVREPNKAALALYKKMGFVEEGIHPKAVYTDTGFEDLISMGLIF